MKRAIQTTETLSLAIVLGFLSVAVSAEEPKAATPAADKSTPAELIQKFTDEMNGVKLIGRFTISGKDDGPAAKEEYTIRKVEKLPDGDKWLIHARIKYGKHDVVLPLPLDVKWAGKTAVITLDEMVIPTLGTFSSRVVIDSGKYAGTWKHDKVGGHLFGTIEKLSPEELEKEKQNKDAANVSPADASDPQSKETSKNAGGKKQ